VTCCRPQDNLGPLAALCDAGDSKHRTALMQLEALATHDFAVCDAVLTWCAGTGFALS